MQHDDREPGAERPDSGGSESPEVSEADRTRPDGESAPREEVPAAAEAWPSQPGPDATETAEWRSLRAEQQPPPSEVEAYPAGASVAGASQADDPTSPTATSGAHSVPASESLVGESTQCPRCGTENRPGLAFCRNCGQRLMTPGASSTVERPGTPEGSMACPRCGTHNRAGVAFCQNCGANLRGVGAGYVAPADSAGTADVAAARGRRGAVLGPMVLLVGLIGLITGYLLPFAYGSGSLWERASAGYGVAFWNGYPEVGAELMDQLYFGLAAPLPLLGALVVVLIAAGLFRASPGPVQTAGLGIMLLWCAGLAALFILVELVGSWDGDLVGLLRVLTPAGIIFFLSSLIVIIGTLTRFGRS